MSEKQKAARARIAQIGKDLGQRYRQALSDAGISWSDRKSAGNKEVSSRIWRELRGEPKKAKKYPRVGSPRFGRWIAFKKDLNQLKRKWQSDFPDLIKIRKGRGKAKSQLILETPA